MKPSPGGVFAWLAGLALAGFVAVTPAAWAEEAKMTFRAGAFAIDITPTNFPVIVNAMFEERSATNAFDRLHARSLALDDGNERIVISVVDTCMLPRELIDEAKTLASKKTGISMDRMLISATHTHSAPSAMGCLGSRVDAQYARYLPGRIAEGIERAVNNLAPARIGWGVINDYEHTHCRRWIRRPDRMLTDPFGNKTVRANMHPGYKNPDAIGPSGPVDPGLSLIALQTPDGKPVAALANYSMHYYGSPLLSADYYGRFAKRFAKLVGAEGGNGPFVAIMSQGTSGDQAWMDYGQPEKQIGLEAYSQEIAEVALEAYRKIEFHDWAPLAMRETKFTLDFRVPDESRLAWAQEVVSKMQSPVPRGQPEIYAQEAIYLHDRPTAELVLQAIKIGELGLTAIPNEVYAITGLKIKAQSPFSTTFNIELANGAEGYIPPPEQHPLGGYTTWPARTAGLEVKAEPRIVEESLRLLEQVSGKPRRRFVDENGEYAKTVLAANPACYWRLNEFSGPTTTDATGHGHSAQYEGGLAFYMDGPQSPAFSRDQTNRAPHFAGGRLNSKEVFRGDTYSLELWFWNGLPADARAITGYLFVLGSGRDRLFIDGTSGSAGHLGFTVGQAGKGALSGKTVIRPKTWNHLVLVRQGKGTRVYLNGQVDLEGEIYPGPVHEGETWLLAGSPENESNFEGKIDEVARYDIALAPEDVARHFHAAGLQPNPLEAALPAPKLSSPPKSPPESLAMMRVPDGFEIELVAAEPLVASPVAIDWGADGSLWVVEMADYPMGMDGKMKPGGRVRRLEDTKGDGHFDKSTVFLDGLNFPNGLITWRKGIIVTAAPDIIYAEDTDGDGKADKREALYTGFAEGNLQLRVNGLRWGLDNWLHCANGLSGGRPRSLKTGAQLDLSGHDLRLKPDQGLLETESGQSEFGRNCNDWGDWFGCDNSYPLFHFVLEDRYLRRNPHVAAPESKRQAYLPANPKVYPRSLGQKRYHSFEHSGHFTSACSTDFYRDELLFPRSEDEHAFTCEPVHNLVQHLRVTPEGVSFNARRAEGEGDLDFLTSADQWFRPVMARTGPDGALWVVDMYRYMIEHPDWLPPEGRKELEPFYRQGQNRGRIYRIFPRGQARLASTVRPLRLDKLSTEELVATLASPNGWQREKAQQLLLWRGDNSAVAPLRKLLAGSLNPLARLHALCTLDGLGALKPEALEQGFRDLYPAVRRHALRLADSFQESAPDLVKAAAKLAGDPNPKVKLQLACSLGEWSDPRAGEALARLAIENSGDRYITAAVMSSALNHVEALVTAVAKAGGAASENLAEPLLNLSFALNRREFVAQLLIPILTPREGEFTTGQMKTFRGFLDMLGRRKTSARDLMADGDDSLTRQLHRADELFVAARRAVANPADAAARRAAAAALSGRNPARVPEDVALLGSLLAPATPGEVQVASVKALAFMGEARVPELLMTNWAAHPPQTRSAILDELLGRESWSLALLNQVETGHIAPVDLDAPHRGRLLKHKSETVRTLAAKAFASVSNPDRQRVIEIFLPALELKGEPERGKAVFARLCSNCHRLDEVGRDIGPNLISVKAHSPEKLLASILDPSREVDPRYLAYNCTLNNGEELYGLIASETGNGIVLTISDGNTRNVLRSEIKSLHSTKTSLMPDGLEAGMTPQDLADLIRYLRAQPGVD